ncbi:MAG: discoidin domain-containing protein [Thermogemmatispora sp.]|uniref:discoidin domain-containing protein n=1 Tax=Thermogemmatispora sp. TaxID=1968838 RepID=UPI0026227A8E|nr:discoidin domain-containing protein [Thermogemmatispora sp.]MBX5457158.1 discoidin domain-containing protein [Thermogemmatispora sp.]
MDAPTPNVARQPGLQRSPSSSSPPSPLPHLIRGLLILTLLCSWSALAALLARAPIALAAAPIQINAGGPAASPFIADTDFSGGGTSSSSNSISTAGVTNPAPQAVYQTARLGNFSYSIPSLTPGASYTVRLHFAETYWTASGKRVFNVSLNGQTVLANFDIFAAAGGANKAVVKEFTATASSSGTITLQFSSVVDQAQLNGLEVLPASSSGWTLVWSDNFSGPAGSSPSADNWIIDTGTGYPGGAANWGTGEVETMSNSTSNVYLDGNNHLNITAINNNGSWTSGRIETKRSDFAAPAGGMLQITASIKQPNPANGLGYWPAFSAMGAQYRGNYQNWPAVGQIDILEDVNGRNAEIATLHCGSAPGGPCNEYNGLTSGLATCPGCQSGYHTYSVIIDRSLSDEQIRWYLDNQQIWIVRESQVGVSAWQAAVDHSFFLIFDLAIGGSFPNTVCGCTTPTSATSSGGTLSIASVAVYQKTGTAPPALTTPPTPSGASVVKVTGTQGNWQLQVNGSPYLIKGVTFGPPNAAALAYMPDLQALGVNTIRTWGTDSSTQSLLDAAAAYGIKVINGFWLSQSADYVNDSAYKASQLSAIQSLVNTYKNSPAVLMWDVGNEVLLSLQNTFSGTQLEQERNAYAQFVDQIAQAIHAIDPNHPVTSTDAWTGAWQYYKANAPHLDLYAVNSYGAVCNVKQDWINGGYTVPYIVTESGPPGEWEVPNDANGVPQESTDVQSAQGYANAWNCITSHSGVALGATLFNYGIENDFGGVWFNLKTGGWKRLAYYTVQQLYTGQTPPASSTPPVISNLTVSTNTVPAGGQFTLSASVSNPGGNLLRYNIMFCSKYIDGSTGLSYAIFSQTGTSTFTVTAPKVLGTWKVYLYAYDGQGNVGIETRSFKVVPPPVNGTNVAIGKPTTASSYQTTGNGAPYPPSNATDGNLSTRWASDWSDPQWIMVDLGQVTQISHIQLVWEVAYGSAYQIQVSNDGSTWTTIYSTTSGTGGVDDFDVSGSGRYVRLYGTARGTPYGYSLWEFGIYTHS